jgi:predicted metalloprotease with PDZ domain
MLQLRRDAELERLVGDWKAVHEFVHLALPRVRRQGAWLSEGLATYYQEVLRARHGLLPPMQAWRNLADGFRRGRASGTGRTLQRESASMHDTHAYKRVYWSGAAFALELDVRLRKRSGGRRSLDTVLQAAHGPAWQQPQGHGAGEVLEQLARASGSRLPVRLGRQYAGMREFPEVRPMLRRLGLSLDGDGLVKGHRAGAPLREIRQGIMGPLRTVATGASSGGPAGFD